jgi:hypothetical protein
MRSHPFPSRTVQMFHLFHCELRRLTDLMAASRAPTNGPYPGGGDAAAGAGAAVEALRLPVVDVATLQGPSPPNRRRSVPAPWPSLSPPSSCVCACVCGGSGGQPAATHRPRSHARRPRPSIRPGPSHPSSSLFPRLSSLASYLLCGPFVPLFTTSCRHPPCIVCDQSPQSAPAWWGYSLLPSVPDVTLGLLGPPASTTAVVPVNPATDAGAAAGAGAGAPGQYGEAKAAFKQEMDGLRAVVDILTQVLVVRSPTGWTDR